VEFSANNTDSQQTLTFVLATGVGSGTRYIYIARAVNDTSVDFDLRLTFVLAVPLRKSFNSSDNSTGSGDESYDFVPASVSSTLPAYTFDRFVFYFPDFMQRSVAATYTIWFGQSLFLPYVMYSNQPVTLETYSGIYSSNSFSSLPTTTAYRCQQMTLWSDWAITALLVHRGSTPFPVVPTTDPHSYSFSVTKSDGSDACAFCDRRNA
jgi:hypothetical protein